MYTRDIAFTWLRNILHNKLKMEQMKTLLHPKLNNIQLIPFVSSSPDVNESVRLVEQRCESSLTGIEASNFYNGIISTPTISKNRSLQKDSCSQKSVCDSELPLVQRLKSKPKPVNRLLTKNLFFYSQEGNLKEIKKCLELTNQINQQDTFGWTPIMCAAIEGHYDVVKYLLECGADLSIKNKLGMSVLDIVERGNHVHVADLLRNGIKVLEKSEVFFNSDEAGIKFCKECSLSFKESVVSHEKSIAHLFSSVKKQDSTFYHIPENNKGFQIMLKSGWDKDKGLGVNADGRKFPIKTILKKDRSCIGRGKAAAKITHFGPNDSSSIKHQVLPVKLLREKTLKNRDRHKMHLKQRQKEIDFRRQFHCD